MSSKFLYVVSSPKYGTDHLYKFGYTENIWSRLASYQTNYPEQIVLHRLWRIDYVPQVFVNYKEIDKILHKIWAKFVQESGRFERITSGGTEWWMVSDGDVDRFYRIYEERGFHLVECDVNDIPKKTQKLDNMYDTYYDFATIGNGLQLQEKQQDLMRRIFTSVMNGEKVRGIAELSVGFGKTICGLAVHHFMQQLVKPTNTLWITYRNDIVESQCSDFDLVLGTNNYIKCNNGMWSKKRDKLPAELESGGRLVVVLRQSLDNTTLDGLYDKFGCVIVDEAHECVSTGFRVILDRLLNSPTMIVALGMTGTPFTEDATQIKNMREVWGDGNTINRIVEPYTLIDAASDGRLTEPYVHFARCSPDLQAALSELRKGKDGKLHPDNLKTLALKFLNDTELRGAPYYKHILKVGSIEGVNQLYEGFMSLSNDELKGYTIFKAHSGESSASYNIRKFKDTHSRAIIITCAMLETGFNDPTVTMVTLAKDREDYQSHNLIQAWGRCLRLAPGKTRGVLQVYMVDATDANFLTHKIVFQLFPDSYSLRNSRLYPSENDKDAKKDDKVMKMMNMDGLKVLMGLTIEGEDSLLVNSTDIVAAVEKVRAMCEINTDRSYASVRKNINKIGIKCPKDYRNMWGQYGLPEDPQVFFGRDWKGWTDFLGIPTDKYYSLSEAIHKAEHYFMHLSTKEINMIHDKCLTNMNTIYKYLSDKDPKFPPIKWLGDWCNWYMDDSVNDTLTNILGTYNM